MPMGYAKKTRPQGADSSQINKPGADTTKAPKRMSGTAELDESKYLTPRPTVDTKGRILRDYRRGTVA